MTSPPHKPPYLRLSSYYFFFFAALGVFAPYWSVYLKEGLSYNPIQIGQVMAVFMGTKLIAPFLWGWLADHVQHRLRLVRIAGFLTLVFLLGVYINTQFFWMLMIVGLFGFFWNAALPQFEALTLNHLGEHSNRYSHIRLWGSIGFILAVILIPYGLEHVWGYGLLPAAMGLLFLLMWLSTWLVTDKDHHVELHHDGSILHILKQPIVLVLLLACVLQQASHGAYYTFFSIYLAEYGYTREFTGWMWALGVIAEVFLFLRLHHWIERMGAWVLFAVSVLITSIRWVLLGLWVDVEWVLWLAQTMHAASYAMFHGSAIYLIHKWFPGNLQGRGQALYAGLSFGLGGAIGSAASGYSWDYLGAEETFLYAAIVSSVGFLLVLKFIKVGNKHVTIG